MSWFEVVPVALAAAGWLVGPGAALAYAIGLRGLSAWGMAPTFSTLITAFTAVVAGRLGIPWSPVVVLIATAAVVAVAGIAALALHRVAPPRRSDPRRVLIAAALGLVPTVAIGWYVMVNGMGRPDQLSQTYDAIFHYSAIAHVLDSGDASSLTMGTLGNPATQPVFYPAAWHDVTSLVSLTTGAPVAVAANLTSAVIAMLVWSLSCMLLVRQVVGPSTAAMAVTGVVAVAFTAFPWGLMSFGVLWPNLLGLSLAPAGVAMVLAAVSLAREDVIGRRRALVLAPLVLVACGFAHPNAVFSFLVVALFAMATSVLRWAVRRHREGRTLRGALGVAAFLLVFLGAWRFVATTPAFAGVRTFYWPPFETPARAIGEVLLNATNGRPALWALSVLVVVGAVVAWRTRTNRWLVAAFAGSGLLYVLTAAINRPDTQFITGYWYNDSFRLAAMVPIAAVPLAVLGVTRLAERLGGLLGDRPRAGSRLALVRTPLVLSLLVLLVLAPLTRFFYVEHNSAWMAGTYRVEPVPTGSTLVDDVEKGFLPELEERVPEDALVANNPWDGSAVMLAEVGRRALFPHADIPWSEDQRLLARSLDDAGRDPEVCHAADRLGVEYLLVANRTFWPHDNRNKDYPGLADPGSDPAFELVARDGSVKLYRIDCEERPGTSSR
ncbi:DUF6541 family protein [Saccharothrix syringae]|uniref:Uncharacterized protein n=1 Tax=Saccharothrix syringae TaxID=103733 RepID=A0A5Q0GRP1_SACSY|nr:DUF6541 family protein [Saccharothrix syringae]QFZ16174.1 hypothetical protein EKG83_00700 [Saccharothrix syringae]